jgi:two-component system alkaline phosphatase synthesis response regulator PhoP
MKQILVVDDEPRIAEICRDYLERAGFKVMLAGNGADAVTLARTKQPDLIVLDLGLPKMDGLDVTRALRKRSNVPIIMLTARVEESDKLIGLELGADDYLTKPFNPRELVFAYARCSSGPKSLSEMVHHHQHDVADGSPGKNSCGQLTSTEFGCWR